MQPTHVMRYVVFLSLLLAAFAGCQTGPQRPTDAEIRAKLKTVNLADGISQSEAQIIGQCYFDKNVGCGCYSDVRDDGDKWVVDGYVGYAGLPRHFYIDKHSGRIFGSTAGPDYDNPLAIDP
jgi:hypothetical protein